MTPEDVLRRWAAATDPAVDPLAGPALRAAPARPRWRAVAAVAAAVALVGGVGLWAAAGDGDRPDRVTVATAPEGTGPLVALQVVVEAAGLGTGTTAAQVSLGAGWSDLEAGTSLVADDRVPAGSTRTLTVRSLPCTRGCPPRGPRTAPVDGAGAATCRVPVAVGTGPTRVVVRVDGAAPTCTLAAEKDVPALTVPPAFTLRPALPWDCGAAAWDGGHMVGPIDRGGAEVARRCLADAAAEGRLVEVPTSELQPNDAVRRVWWRVRDGGVEAIRDQPWTTQRCDGVGAEARGVGCGPEEPLSLALPPLDDGAGTRLRVVVDPAGIASGEEGSHHVLVLARDGEEEVAVPVPGGVALLVDRAVAPGRWTVALESWTCNASGCGTETREGRPEDTDVTGPPQRCDAPVTVGAEPLVVLVEGGCTATVVPEVPPLDVPTGWTLRPPLPWSCGTGDVGHGALLDPLSRHAAKDARRCFLAAHEAGEPAELPSAEPRADRSLAPTYWRTDGSGAVEIVRPDGWTVQRCTGLVEAPPPEHMAATGCGPQEPL